MKFWGIRIGSFLQTNRGRICVKLLPLKARDINSSFLPIVEISRFQAFYNSYSLNNIFCLAVGFQMTRGDVELFTNLDISRR